MLRIARRRTKTNAKPEFRSERGGVLCLIGQFAAAAILSAGARMFGEFSCILGVGRENENRRTDRSTVLFLRGDLS